MKYLQQLLVLLISVTSIRSEWVENSCSMSHKIDELCGSYCYGIVKPLLRYAESVQSKEAQFTELTDIIRNLEATVETLKGQIKLGDANKKCELRKVELFATNKGIVQQSQKLKTQIWNQDLEITNLKSEVLGNATKVVELVASKKEVDDKMKELKKQIENRDLEISNLKSQVLGNATKVVELVASKQEVVDKMTEVKKELENQYLEISNLKSQVSGKETEVAELIVSKKEVGEKMKELKKQIENQELEISNLKSQVLGNETKINELEKALSETSQSISPSCIGKPTGIFKIRLPGADPFSVPCYSNLTDPGWTVVQRRQDGSEDFNRNWTDYHVGFGNLSGEFFIGLDKLRLMTKSQQHELKIYLEDFGNKAGYALYSNFLIGGEETNFALLSLGTYSGNVGNSMVRHLNNTFSTPDRGNSVACATRYKSGWWFRLSYDSNLNGVYRAVQERHSRGVNWFGFHYDSLKFVQMMIRPVKK